VCRIHCDQIGTEDGTAYLRGRGGILPGGIFVAATFSIDPFEKYINCREEWAAR